MTPRSSSKPKAMQWSLDSDELAAYTAHQMNFFAAPGTQYTAADLRPFVPSVCRRVEKCFRHIRRKYYQVEGHPVFSHRHGDHYASFLYFLGNTIYEKRRRLDLAEAAFLLNKMLHGVDAFYAVELPDIFLFIHPAGTVLGNARYRNYFLVYQNCTVGSTAEGIYPRFDEGTVLCAKSAVIGDCRCGRNVVFGANSFVLNVTVPSQTTVVGSFPNHRLNPGKGTVADTYFAA